MTKLPAGQLAYTPVVEKQDEFLATVRRLGEVASQALVSNNTDAFRLELERTAKVADDTTRKLSPLTQATAELERHWQSLTNTIKASGAVRSADLKTLRDVETQLKAQIGTLGKYAGEQTGLERVLKNVSAETKALGASQRGVTYQTADVAKYAAALKAITDAQRAGLTSQKDSLAQLKSLQGAMAQYAGSLTEGSRELTELNKVMVATGTASNKLEKEQAKLEAAFRSDYLKIYSGELKSIDAAVRSGTSGFDAGARQVERLSAELRSQQGELGQTGKDFDQLARLLQQAAAQQERYQKAAEAAARSNDTAQLRAFGTELRQLEAGLQDVTVQAGKLDAQQRAIRYDSAGVRSYRTETEGLSGAFGKVGQGLGDLQSRIVTYARGLSDGGREQAELTRIMQGTEKAAQSLAQAQERTAQSYRSAELSRFTTELKNIETAQRAGAISAEQAQRAVQELQAEFKAYAASLGVTERELSTFARSQQDAGKSADQFAQAQERAQRSFDTRALASFRGELEQIIRGQREGSASFDQTARAVESLQGRMREYGSSLGTAGGDQADLNRLLELSERALVSVGTAAERAGRGFNAAPVRDYGRELDGLGDAGTRLEGSLSDIGDDLDRLGGSFRDAGQDARASAQDHEAFGSATRELDGSLAGIEQELSQLGASFREAGTDARASAGEQERLGVSLRDLGGSLGNTAREFTQLGGAVRESGSSANLTQREYQGLEGVMRSLEGAAGRLAGEQEKLDAAFHAEQLRGYNSALLDLKRAHEAGASSQEQFTASARELSDQLERSRTGLDTSSKAYVGYTQALTRVDSSLAQAEGRMRTFGVASSVTAGITDQLSSILYLAGPAGEGMAVAMSAAGVGMEGAAVGAKLLNIALAAGLVGALIAVGVGLFNVVKASVSFEQAQADVAKSTGLSRDGINQLTDALQDISRATGTPTEDLLGLAAVAGQLGVTGTDNIAKFTDTINKLAIATNITGEEGAEALSKFINLTKDAGQSVGDSANLVGNVINALGSSLAATESDILHMSQRLGTLKASANLSQVEILGLSGGMVSLGLTAERAETSTTKLFTDIAVAASQGGKQLEVFARAAGLSVDQFTKLQKESPADAFLAVVEGLRKAKDAGQDLNPILTEITGKNTTMRNVLLTLVGGFDTLEQSMKTAGQEAKTQTSLQKELETRLNTVAGQWSLFTANVRTAGESLGRVLAPVLRDTLKGLNELFDTVVQVGGAVGAFAQTLGKNIFEGFGGGASDAEIQLGELETQLGLTNTKTREAVEALSQAERAALTSSDALSQLGTQGATAVDGLDKLKTATGKEGLQAAVDQLASTLTGDAKQAFITFAQQAIASGGDAQRVAEVISKSFKSVQIDALNTKLELLRQKQAANLTEIIELEKVANVEVIEGIQTRLQAARQQLASLESQKAKGQEVNEYLIQAAKDQIIQLEAQEAQYKATYGTLGTQLIEARTEGYNLENAIDGVTKQVETLGKQNGPKGLTGTLGEATVAAGGAEGAVFSLSKAQATYNDLQKLALPQAKTYLDNLQSLKAAYPELASKLNPLIEATKKQVDELTRTKPAAEGAGHGLRAAGEETQSYGDKLREMGPLLTSLQGSFQKTKLKLEIDEDPREAMAKFRTIAETAAAAAEQALLQGRPNRAEAFIGIEAEARGELDKLHTAVRETMTGVDSSFQEGGRAADDFSTSLGRLNQTGATQSIINNIGAIDTFSERTLQATGITQDQAEALRLSQIEFENTRVAQINATNTSENYVASIIEGNKNAFSFTETLHDNTDAWLDNKEAADESARTNLLNTEQMRTQTEVMTELRHAVELAEENFLRTGDANQLAADKAEIYQAAVDAMRSAGIEPTNVALQNFQSALQLANAELSSVEKQQAYADVITEMQLAMKAAGDEAQIFGNSQNLLESQLDALKTAIIDTTLIYGANSQEVADLKAQYDTLLQTYKDQNAATEEAAAHAEILGDAQAALADTSSIATEDIGTLVDALGEVVASGGDAGAQAQQLTNDLKALEVAREIADYFTLLGDFATKALENIPGLSDAAKGALGGLAGASEATFNALQDGAIGAGDAFNIAAGLISGIADALGDDVDPALKSTLDVAASTAQGAAAGFAVGGPLGAAIGGVIGLFTGLATEIGEAREAAIAAAKAAEEAYRKLDDLDATIGESTLDALETANDTALAMGKLTEGEALIYQTQIDLANLQLEFKAEVDRLNAERQELIDSLDSSSPTYEADVAAINEKYDNLIAAETQGYQANVDAILQGGIEQAAALGISTEQFLGAVEAVPDEIANAYDGAGFAVQDAVMGFAGRYGVALDFAYGEIIQGDANNRNNLNSQIVSGTGETVGALSTRGTILGGAALGSAKVFADALIQGGLLGLTGIQQASSLQTQGVGTYTKDLNAAVVTTPGVVTPAVLNAHQAISAAFGTGGQQVNTGIGSAFSVMLGGLNNYGPQFGSQVLGIFGGVGQTVTTQGGAVAGSFSTTGTTIQNAIVMGIGGSASVMQSQGSQFGSTIQGVFGGVSQNQQSGVSNLLSVVNSTFGNLTGAYRAQSSTFGSTILLGGQQVSGATGSAFSLMGGAQNQGSSQYQGVILRSGQQLSGAQTQLTSLVTGALRSMGSTLTGALSSTYSSLVGAQNSGASNYIGAINNAARGEKGAIDQGSGVVTGALGGFRQSITGSIDSTYSGIGGAHLRGSSNYQSVVRSGADRERSALASAASTVTGQLSSSARSIVGGIQQHFSSQESAYERAIGSYVGTINSQRSRLETALNAVASFIKNFKYPTPPAPPALPSARASADPGDFAPMVSFGVPDLSIASVGAYAADGLPDVAAATYASATGSVRAYAAAAAPLLDMFDVSTPNLRLTNVQERSLSLTIGGAENFGKAFEKPIASFERAINFLWETVKYDRETTLLFRRTVDDFGTKAKTTREALAPGTRHQAKRRR